MKPKPFRCRLAGLRTRGLVLVSAITLVNPALRAVQFTLGDVKGSFDTTLSVGGLYRLNQPDPDYYGTTATSTGTAGRQNSVNTGSLGFPMMPMVLKGVCIAR